MKIVDKITSPRLVFRRYWVDGFDVSVYPDENTVNFGQSFWCTGPLQSAIRAWRINGWKL